MTEEEQFEAYLESPLSELSEDDAGRNDKHKALFLDFGLPRDLMFRLWKEIRRQADNDYCMDCGMFIDRKCGCKHSSELNDA